MSNRSISTRLLILFCTVITLSSCEDPQPPVVAASRPVKSIVVGDTANLDQRSFPAIVDAIRKAEISFRVSGKLNSIKVKEGDQVKKDQLLATLDPTDFKITLKDREASYQTAKANYERAKELVDKGAISRVDHDNIRAKYHSAEAALKEARQNLEYTRLKANFDGYIAKRHVENFEEVKASQSIFSLEDVSSLKLIIDVPENLMIQLKRKPGGEQRKLSAHFDRIPDKVFDLKVLEAATKADADSNTFKVTLTMPKDPDYNILPGMTATVTAELFPEESASNNSFVIPSDAVVANNDKQPVVWVVDEKTMTVHPQTVTTGLLANDTIQVTGLKPGERVVTAGAAFLRDGMKVTLLKTGEQPE
jgi:RND family efflux transporter MFP subunit